jgi:hypothetical protein
MYLSFLAPLLLLAQASEHAATDATQETEAAANGETKEAGHVPEGTFEIDKEKVRCRYETPLGSKIPKKVCHSLAEWEARQKMQEDEMRSGRNRNSSCGSDGGPC